MSCEMPEIGTYKDVREYLKLARSTVYKLVSQDKFPDKVYIGHGRFNMRKLQFHIERNGTWLKERSA